MPKNEAELEARISAVLSNYPSFKSIEIKHQKNFSIKLGHHAVTVDLKDPSIYGTRAIYDILLTIDDKNIMLLELKKEGLKLSNQDVDQGISYARLVHPMPPITLISNGIDNLFYNTYNKELIDPEKFEFQDIQNYIDNSFKLAVNDFKEAVMLLLNNDPEVFAKIINNISQQKFNYLIGEIDDVSKPVCHDFCIERELLSSIETKFDENQLMIGVIGAAYSGKTNLLYQFFNLKKEKGEYALYINCLEHEYSILQQLANNFTASSKTLITKDKIREWLINSIDGNSFYLLIDNFNTQIPEELKAEIIELIDLMKDGQHHVLYTIDEYNFKQVGFVQNRRYRTIIGEESKIFQLHEFNDFEFENVQIQFLEKYHIGFENGAQNTLEYRQPRILKCLISIYKGEILEGKYTKIMAVPDLALLNNLAENDIYTTEVKKLYKKIAQCFIEERSFRRDKSHFEVMAFSTGAITLDYFKQKFSEDFDRLIESPYIVLRELKDEQVIVYPKIPELIAFYCKNQLTDILLQEHEKGVTMKYLTDYFLEIISPVPFPDIIGAGILFELAQREYANLFSDLISELIKMAPKVEKLNAGTQTLMYMHDIGHIQMNFETDIDDGSFISNFLPYPILSQLAGIPFYLDVNAKSELSYNLFLFQVIGSQKQIVSRVQVNEWRNMKPLEYYCFDEIGEFLNAKHGIIEPVVQSIQKCFYLIPNEIKVLYENAFDENNYNLLYRIYLALRELIGSVNEKTNKEAKVFVERFNQFWHEFMTDFLIKDIFNQEEKERIKRLLSIEKN